MEIEDEERARYWLRHVSYYRLSAYWLFYENPKAQEGPRFVDGTTFDKVTDLYDFDRNLRRLVMRGTEHVEVSLRGSWAYHLAHSGDDGHSYLTPQMYQDRSDFHKHLAKLASEVGWSRETYIKHYRETYDEPPMPPVWMVAEMMSFGQLSRWYSDLASRNLRNEIASHLGYSQAVLVPLVVHITDIRNICAHHGRLWNRQFLKPPKLAKQPEYIKTSLNWDRTQAPAYLYNSLVMIAHIVQTVAPNSSWPHDVAALLATQSSDRLTAMGCPDDWKSKAVWSQTI